MNPPPTSFSLFIFTFIKNLFNSSSLSAIRVVPSAYMRLLIFLPAILIPVCQGPALVDQGNSKVGMASASLEKYIFNYRYIERLEMDSVVGDSIVEKRRLNPDGNSAREMGARKKRHGESVFPETDLISLFWGLLIYLLLHMG